MENFAINNSKITTLNWCHKLGTIGETVEDIDDIKQCYAVIFSTQKGTVVHNPNLGWDILQYLSQPIDTVESKIKTELMTELNYQEPRATVTNVTLSYNDIADGKLSAEIEFDFENKIETVTVDM